MHNASDSHMPQLSGATQIVSDDLDNLLDVLPPHICDPLQGLENRRELLEVVMDLGREPEARLPGREVLLSTHPVTEEDIDYVVQRIGAFGDDNRAGIERTLHRISAIRNREGRIVGITCRVGRAVFGTITIIRDIVESGRSILMMGRPGVGKTTLLREAARVLADDLRKRVMIVDTSNEIGGDGDIPHPAVGRARRMQVPTPSAQHAVMIEAVENHMPEVIVIVPNTARPTRQVMPTMRPSRLRIAEMRCSVRSMPARLSSPNAPIRSITYSRSSRPTTSELRITSRPG